MVQSAPLVPKVGFSGCLASDTGYSGEFMELEVSVLEEGGESVLQGCCHSCCSVYGSPLLQHWERFLAEEFVPQKPSRGRAAVEGHLSCCCFFPFALERGEGGKLRILVMGGRENNVLIQMGEQGLLQVCLLGTCNSILCDVFHKMPVFALLPLPKSLTEILHSSGCRWGCT